MAATNTPEAAALVEASLQRLDYMRSTCPSTQAHELGDAWFLAAAYTDMAPDSYPRTLLRESWVRLEGELMRQSSRERWGSVRAFGDGARVTSDQSDEYRMVKSIGGRIPQVIGREIESITRTINNEGGAGITKLDITAGARVLIAAFVDLSGMDVDGEGADFARKIIRHGEGYSTIYTGPVIHAIAELISLRKPSNTDLPKEDPLRMIAFSLRPDGVADVMTPTR